MSRTTFRLAWRHARRRPLQSFFFVAGVAIGVAMIIAIDLANGAATRAFDLGTESITGRATHQIIGGPGGLDEGLYVELRRDLGYRLSAPVVEGYVVVDALDGQPMRLLGIDPFAEAPFRSYLGGGAQASDQQSNAFLTDLMARPNTVLLSAAVAERYGLTPGATIDARVGTRRESLEIVGLLMPADDLSRRALDGLLIADIATGQEVLDRIGRMDRIDLILPDGAAGEAVQVRIRAILPPGARLEESGARSGTVQEMTAAFRLNLAALSMLALVVGVFLIYNTVTFSVVQRRPVLGSLRALGMTRREIFAVILTEAGVLGLIGSLLGVGLGVLLGRGAVQAVTQTVNDLFFVVAVRDVEIPFWTLLKGALIGVAAALGGALIPALEATSVPPAGAFQRSDVEERTRHLLPWISGAALLLLMAGGLLLIPDGSLVVTFGGLFTIVIGCALLTPMITLWLMRLVGRLLGERADVVSRMAPRSIIRSLSRTSVAMAALMVAVSVIIGVGVMISSFRSTVELWLDSVLQADLFISAPALSSSQAGNPLTPDILDRVIAFPGIRTVATNRSIDAVALPAGASGPATPVRLVALSNDLAGDQRRYRAAIGDWRETWQAVEAGSILINEPMANRTDLRAGDTLLLQSDQGPIAFSVAGVTVDFDVNNVVFMDDKIYRRYWADDLVSAIGAYVEPNVDADEMVAALRADFAGDAELLIRSNRGTRENALEVFDRTFAITVALQLLATIVAFIGILSTLMSLQLERKREIGVLRATGMTRGQLWRLSLLETGLIGSSAGLIAMPVGLLLAIILIYIINLRSFGWTLQMQLAPGEFLQAFLVALAAALLAGLYPAWRMGRIQPADAVRSE
ncbi:MAG: ABC transporter permease [Caldilineaceae bacterium]|nr:ABC transporter permease [Caldilineaceae bacterium]